MELKVIDSNLSIKIATPQLESNTWSWKIYVYGVKKNGGLGLNPIHGVESISVTAPYTRARVWSRIQYMELKVYLPAVRPVYSLSMLGIQYMELKDRIWHQRIWLAPVFFWIQYMELKAYQINNNRRGQRCLGIQYMELKELYHAQHGIKRAPYESNTWSWKVRERELAQQALWRTRIQYMELKVGLSGGAFKFSVKSLNPIHGVESK